MQSGAELFRRGAEYRVGHGWAPRRDRLAQAVPGTVEAPLERPAWFWLMLWCLFVLGVQPWSARVAAPQGTTGSTNSVMKGLLLGAIFLIALAATKPGFRTRVNPTGTLYVLYVLFATATAFLLAEPLGPLTRLARFLIGLVLVFLLWRPLVQVPERLVRAHLWAHLLLAITVVASLAWAPSQAWRPLSSFGTGYRLQGVIIPMLPPRVGEVGAVLLGLGLDRLRLPEAVADSLGRADRSRRHPDRRQPNPYVGRRDRLRFGPRPAAHA